MVIKKIFQKRGREITMKMRRNVILNMFTGILIFVLILTGCGGRNAESASGSGGSDATSVAASANASPEVITCSMHSIAADGSVIVESARMFADKVKEYTNGSIIINVFPGGQLGSDEAAAEDMARGNIEFGQLMPSSLAGLDPMMDCLFLPLIANNYEEADKLFYNSEGIIQKTLVETIAKYDITVLGWFENEFRGLSNSVREVRTANDVKGLKIRVPGSAAVKTYFEELGAQPVVMPMTELYTGLQQGTVDGQDNGPLITHDNNLEESNKYYTYLKHVYLAGTFSVSNKLWSTLTPEQQDGVKKAAEEAQAWQIPASRALVDTYLQEMAASGVTITELTPEDVETFSAAADRTWEKMRSVYGDEFIDGLKAEIAVVRGS